MRSTALPVAVAVLAVLAGCGAPFASDGSPADGGTNAPSRTPTDSPLAPPVDKPTDGDPNGSVQASVTTGDRPAGTGTVPGAIDANGSTSTDTGPTYPPGVGEEGLVNASRLVDAHVRALNATGYRTEGAVTTTVVRSGFRVRIDSDGRALVAAGSEQYLERRSVVAGPLNRTVSMYANGSSEYRRRIRNGQATLTRRDRRPADVLASSRLIAPFLRGGDFNRTQVAQQENETLYTLHANSSDNETAVVAGLPNAADSVRSFEGTAVVDADGRVRRLRTTVGFTIGGRNETHDFSFVVTELGVESVDRPDWVDRVTGTASSTDAAATRRSGTAGYLAPYDGSESSIRRAQNFPKTSRHGDADPRTPCPTCVAGRSVVAGLPGVAVSSGSDSTWTRRDSSTTTQWAPTSKAMRGPDAPPVDAS